MNIYQKINEVMKAVKYVQKDSAIQGYKAVTHDQVVSVARSAMVENGVVISVSLVSSQFDEPVQGAKMRMYRAIYDVFFTSAEDPASQIIERIEAHALDNGDKAPGKCCTYAVKTAVLKVLWLETGENDESRADLRNPDLISDDDAALMSPYLVAFDGANYTWTQKGALLSQQFGFNGVDQIRVKDLGKIKKALGL